MAKISNQGVPVELNDVRTQVRHEIEKRYGSVASFLKGKEAERFGGKKIRCYLYNSGSINYEVLADLCKYLGIGKLNRKIKVVREISYSLISSKEQ